MKFFSTAAALFAVVPSVAAYWKGFNVAANNPDGSCKTQAQWETNFKKLQSLHGHFTSVRLYASSDCGTLANAVPAAIKTGTQILVGLWTEDSTHYGQEKAALQSAIKQYGSKWIIAISVGSEDLYRGDTTASALVQQIYDVRGMVRAMGVTQEVGHVDTWTAWVNGANSEVITASDFIGVDAYPYFQGSDIGNASNVFWEAINNVRTVVNNISPGKWVWVTETGWPVSGSNFGNGVPSVKNAQTYWRSVACAAFKQIHIFWYVHQDYQETPSFGVIGKGANTIYDLKDC